jgi:choline dehydrogenase
VNLSSGVDGHGTDIILVLEQLPNASAELAAGFGAESRQDLIDFVRTGALSFGHPTGTARMGNDADAVVDSELRVHGVRGLRVADASVMPSIISGATNAAAIMIGGRAAEFIRADLI